MTNFCTYYLNYSSPHLRDSRFKHFRIVSLSQFYRFSNFLLTASTWVKIHAPLHLPCNIRVTTPRPLRSGWRRRHRRLRNDDYRTQPSRAARIRSHSPPGRVGSRTCCVVVVASTGSAGKPVLLWWRWCWGWAAPRRTTVARRLNPSW